MQLMIKNKGRCCCASYILSFFPTCNPHKTKTWSTRCFSPRKEKRDKDPVGHILTRFSLAPLALEQDTRDWSPILRASLLGPALKTRIGLLLLLLLLHRYPKRIMPVLDLRLLTERQVREPRQAAERGVGRLRVQ